ncbi:hypothetical protein BH23VER1_BH23VER1_23760 [soil metagenome]
MHMSDEIAGQATPPLGTEGFSGLEIECQAVTGSASVRFVSSRCLVPEVTLLLADPDGGVSTHVRSVMPLVSGRRRHHELKFSGLEPGRVYEVVVRGGGLSPSSARFAS